MKLNSQPLIQRLKQDQRSSKRMTIRAIVATITKRNQFLLIKAITLSNAVFIKIKLNVFVYSPTKHQKQNCLIINILPNDSLPRKAKNGNYFQKRDFLASVSDYVLLLHLTTTA
jgi:hypothetical protein